MPELILRLFDGGARPLRTERLAADSAEAAVDLARARVRGSRFSSATVQFDGACLSVVADGGRGSVGGSHPDEGRRADESSTSA